jgi:hypothetical protein
MWHARQRGIPEGKNHLENLDVNEMKILQLIFKT